MSSAFIVMWPWDSAALKWYKELGCPRTLPWDFIAPHEKQALENHHQSLQRLNERGGLCAVELRAVLEGKTWPEVDKNERGAVQKLIALLHNWERERDDDRNQ